MRIVEDGMTHRVDEIPQQIEEQKVYLDKLISATADILDYGPDAYANKFYEALYNRLIFDPKVQVFYADFLQNCLVSPDQAVLRIAKTSQLMEKDRDPFNFPKGKLEDYAWDDHFDTLVSDGELRGDYLEYLHLPVTANIYNRSKITKVMAQLYGKNNPVILDYGCSLNMHNKMLASLKDGTISFDDTNIVNIKNISNVMINVDDIENTKLFNKIVHSNNFELDYGIGCDIFDIETNPNIVKKMQADSFYMSELLDIDKLSKFEYLRDLNVDNVIYKRPHMLEHFTGQADIVVMSALLYQLSGNKAVDEIHQVKRYVKDDGIIIIKDFVEFDEFGNLQFYSNNDWHNHFNIWVMEMSQENTGFKKIMSCDYGRVNNAILQPAFFDLPKAKELGFI